MINEGELRKGVHSLTVRERVLASRLMLKIDNHEDYAKRIGLGYKVSMVKRDSNECRIIQKIIQKEEQGGCDYGTV